MAMVRASLPSEVAGHRVIELEDLIDGGRLPPSDVLIFTLEGARLVIRPSGTEPKLKCYLEAPSDTVLDELEGALPALLSAVVDEDRR